MPGGRIRKRRPTAISTAAPAKSQRSSYRKVGWNVASLYGISALLAVLAARGPMADASELARG